MRAINGQLFQGAGIHVESERALRLGMSNLKALDRRAIFGSRSDDRPSRINHHNAQGFEFIGVGMFESVGDNGLGFCEGEQGGFSVGGKNDFPPTMPISF